MSATRRNRSKTRKSRTLKPPHVNVVIVTKTTVKGTLFPEKLRKMNEMLKNAKMLDS